MTGTLPRLPVARPVRITGVLSQFPFAGASG
jgi:hypothetical protein